MSFDLCIPHALVVLEKASVASGSSNFTRLNCIMTSWASNLRLKVKSIDIASSYLQQTEIVLTLWSYCCSHPVRIQPCSEMPSGPSQGWSECLHKSEALACWLAGGIPATGLGCRLPRCKWPQVGTYKMKNEWRFRAQLTWPLMILVRSNTPSFFCSWVEIAWEIDQE